MARTPAKKAQRTLVQLFDKCSVQSVKINDDGSLTIVFDGDFDSDYQDISVQINGTDGCGIAAKITSMQDLVLS